MSDSYYELLGIDPDASEEEIETAYREKVKQVHPDKSDSPDAKEMFMRVREAREVLLDPKERAQYDRRRSNSDARNTAQQGYQYQQQQHRQRKSTDSGNKGQHGPDQSRTRTSRQNQTETREREHRWKNDTEYDDPLSDVWVWILALFENIQGSLGRFLEVVRSPKSLSTDRSLFKSLISSPTGIRLSATFMIVIVGTILTQYLEYIPHESPSVGLTIVMVGLVGSYTGYEILSPLPFEETWIQSRSRYDPDGKQRIWPIAVTNTLGVGLAFSAFISGAIYGGIAFTGALLLPFTLPLLLYSRTQPTQPGANRVIRLIKAIFEDAYRFASLVVTAILALVLFTNWFIDTPSLLAGPIDVDSFPWFDGIVLGSVRVGLLLNLLVGLFMYVCLLWSIYAMWRYLNAAPWTDRYDHGYRVRPGLWNLFISGPFVVFGWMVLAGVATVNIPLGISTLVLSQEIILKGLFFLPSMVTVLYILRRRLEPTLRREVYHQ
jgi:curved DNA-binding protein CbpA